MFDLRRVSRLISILNDNTAEGRKNASPAAARGGGGVGGRTGGGGGGFEVEPQQNNALRCAGPLRLRLPKCLSCVGGTAGNKN